jgi:DNA-binding beta-propeller fold protein YncE
MTRAGKYVFVANTGSGTISRLVGTGNHVFVDNPVAATIATGAPADIDAAEGALGVIDHGSGRSHLSLFTYNRFGELTATGAPIDVGAANANGMAILPPARRNRN